MKADASALDLQRLAFIALGSNLGDSQSILRAAAKNLEQFSDMPLHKSSLWQSTPVDCPPGSPAFLNAVIGLLPRSAETPESLLAKLQEAEKQSGRQSKKILNEPRPLDLDLIAFADQFRCSKNLTLPHPRAHERRFVLEPLSEIAPDLMLPSQTETVQRLLEKLPADSGMRKLHDSL